MAGVWTGVVLLLILLGFGLILPYRVQTESGYEVEFNIAA